MAVADKVSRTFSSSITVNATIVALTIVHVFAIASEFAFIVGGGDGSCDKPASPQDVKVGRTATRMAKAVDQKRRRVGGRSARVRDAVLKS